MIMDGGVGREYADPGLDTTIEAAKGSVTLES